MNKKSIIIICILSLIVIGLIGGIIYINNYYIKQLDYIFYTNADESGEREYDCSFTNTHKIIQMLDYHFAMDGVSYAIVDDFQGYQPYIVVIPKDMETKLEKDKYYEFTYKLNGKGIIKDFNDLNSYLIGTLNNKSRGNDSVGTIYVGLEIKETDKKGLDQVQENICTPKPSTHDAIKFNEYLTRDEGRIIYLVSNMDEFYVYDSNNKKQTLKDYAKTWQTIDDIIKHITDKYDLYGELNDGGTKIYKSNKDNATIVVCHTTFGNKDVFIGDYNMQFDNESMCKR